MKVGENEHHIVLEGESLIAFPTSDEEERAIVEEAIFATKLNK